MTFHVRIRIRFAVFMLGAAFAMEPSSAGSPPAATAIEVYLDGEWLELHKAVVPTPTPLVRITRGADVPSDLRVLLTREDGRAGYSGMGKWLSVGPPGSGAVFEELSPGVYLGIVATLTGRNSIILTNASGSILKSGTMLNYSLDREDANGNGVLDEDEDLNSNGVLDPGEDLNGNELLDVFEDVTGDGLLTTGEDLNGNGLLDEGEDRNGNGELDFQVALPVDALLTDESVMHPLDFEVQAHAVQLAYTYSATHADISRHLQYALNLYGLDIEPVGLAVDDMTDNFSLEIISRIADGTPPADAARILNGQSPGDYQFPPPSAPPLPLVFAAPLVTLEPMSTAGERLPARLVAGNVAPNNGAESQPYAADRGLFDNNGTTPTLDEDGDSATDEDPREAPIDNDGDGRFDEDQTMNGIDEDGDGRDGEDPHEQIDDDGDSCFSEDRAIAVPADELDLFWHHFFMQTFPAQGLLRSNNAAGEPNFPFPAADRQRALAIVDTGFGNGNAAPTDIAAGRIVRPHNQTGIAFNQGAAMAAPAVGAAVNGAGMIQWARIADNTRGCPTTLTTTPFHPSLRHGTRVAGCSSATGTLCSGTGERAPIRPVRTNGANLVNAIQNAASDANTSVINVSWGFPTAAAGAAAAQTRVLAARANHRIAIQRAIANNKIIVIAAGNTNENADRQFPAIYLAPNFAGTAINDDGDGVIDEETLDGRDNDGDGQIDEDVAEYAGAIAVSATGIRTLPVGPEQRASFSCFGQRILISAPGQNVNTLNPIFGGAAPTYQITGPTINGTSFAAPAVAGAIAELINYAGELPAGLFTGGTPAVTQAQRDLRVAQIVLATGDDLGNASGADAQGNFPNDGAGNGPDNHFGIGRLNMWKASLSVVNQGLARQHSRPDADANNRDDRFTNIPLINDANTRWYGFEIITSEPHAEVWIDGTRVTDANATTPGAPDITAYAGVKTHIPNLVRGVHTRGDGAHPDGGNTILEEEPLTGIVPDGCSAANRGPYVIRFSATRGELYDGANPRTLSLRRRNAGVNSKPFYNLLLETAKMREEGNTHVTGVVFDDFVFQITVPDYGDAPLAPTLMTENGARHINSALEWLGRPGAANRLSITGEVNAETEALSGNPRVDADGVTNRAIFHDRDGRDDGVVFYPLTYEPLSNTGKVVFTIGVADKSDPRYAAQAGEPNPNPDRNLYFNLWIDWDNNGVWEEINAEHVLNGVRIQPRDAATWNVIDSGTSGATVTCISTTPDRNYATFECTNLPVGLIGCGSIWARARLDYGENVGRNIPALFRSLPSLRHPVRGVGCDANGQNCFGLVHGAARYGEVEDYFIGSEFGDAPDDGLGNYPTLWGTGGARHLDFHQEWLGVCCLPLATREIDADDANFFCGGDDVGSDQDGESNLSPYDTDNLDDGVTITACGPCGPGFTIEVTVTSSIGARGGVLEQPGGSVAFPEDDADTLPRYDLLDANRLLYLRGWADWNGNGVWDDDGELIIDETVNPMGFGADGGYTLGEPFTDANHNGVWDPGEAFIDLFGQNTHTFEFMVFPQVAPDQIAHKVWFRFRLSYGEGEQLAELQTRACDEDARFLDGPRGGALFGEVEDYVIITDDTCWFPRYVTEGHHEFDTTEYSHAGPNGPCGGNGPDIWFAYTATCTGTATADTCAATNYDTVIDVYEGVGWPAPDYINCNDDGPGFCPPQSSISFPVVAGQTYTIRVAGKTFADRGPGLLRIHCKSAGPILYVNQAVVGGNQSGSDWANAVPTLTRALELARQSYDPNHPDDGLNIQEIWVASGTYTPTDNPAERGASFVLIGGIGHYGGFNGTEVVRNQRSPLTNPTILSGDIARNDPNNTENSYHVVRCGNVPDTTILDGFIVTAGNANGDGPFDNNGALFFMSNQGSPRVNNCIFIGGVAARAGGAIYLNEQASPIISWCWIAYNLVTGNCGNCGGGGIYSEFDAFPFITNCRVFGNSAALSNGGGVFFRDNSDAAIGAHLVNTLVEDNSANAGGGICIALHNSARVINCTVRNNSATQFGGGVFVFRCNPYFGNSIFWGDAAPLGAEFAIPFCPSNPTLENCNVQGFVGAMHLGPPAGGGNCNPNMMGFNINLNPLFQADGDLLPGSPCIDVGLVARIPPDVADVDGNGNDVEATPLDLKNRARVVNGNVDLGAFEVPDNSDPYGACCYANGSCALTTQNGCTGRWIGAGVPCDPDPCEIECCPGDTNGDGSVNNFDIDPFVDALVNGGGYRCEADTNCDGLVNNFDIDSFVVTIVNGQCGCGG